MAATPIATVLASSITGLDLTVLLLFLHGWGVAVGIAVWSEGSGIDWVDRRVDVGTRPLALLWLVGTVVAWYPFAIGTYPFALDERSRSVVVLVFGGIVLLWAGFYFLGGAVTTLRSYVAIRRTKEIEARSVERGPVQVSGRALPTEDRPPLESPIAGTDVIGYRLAVTQRLDGGSGTASDGLVGSGSDRPSSLGDQTLPVDEERIPFRLEDDTGSVVVDPTDADLRLERTASVAVAEGDRPPEPLASHLSGVSEYEYEDDQGSDRVYHESTLESGSVVSVLGVAAHDSDTATDADSALDSDSDPDPDPDSAPNSAPEPEEDSDVSASTSRNRPTPTITAGESASAFIVAPGSDAQLRRYFLETVAVCILAAVTSTGVGFGLLWVLAGHW